MERHSGRVTHGLALGAAMLAAPALALAGTGPYLGLEAGGNWVGPETYYNQGAVPTRNAKDVFGWAAGVTGGYKFENGLRPEVELIFRTNALRSGMGRSNAPAGMVNLWYDFSLPVVSKLHPYIGGGVGFGRINPILSATLSPNSYRSVFLYQGGAGVSYDFTDHLTGDIGWRWIQTGMKSATAFGGNNTDLRVGRYRANTALISVRYSFGSSPAPAPVPPPPAPVAEAAPAPAAPAQTKENPNRKFENVNFAFDKSDLTTYAKASLDGDAQTINTLAGQYPDLQVDVAGHTDWIGTNAYNQALSERRANAVRVYLESKGVDSSRIHTFAYGETRPIAPNTTAEGRAQNRRAEISTRSPSAAQ